MYVLFDWIIQVSTCSIVGDKDKGLGTAATSKFQQIPNANREIHILEDAGHPCYLEQPGLFHKIMFAFAQKVFGA